MESDELHQTFWAHLEELRQALIKALIIIIAGMAIPLLFQDFFLRQLLYPLHQAMPEAQLALLHPIEGFTTALKLSFWIGLIGTLPLWSFPILQFIVPALNSHERRLILPFILGSLLFLSLGLSLAYFVTLPLANAYFYQYNSAIGVNLWSLSSYLDFTLMILFSHALVAECAMLLLFLIHYGLIGAEALKNQRRIAIVAAFIIGALATPPDVPSQLMVAIPLIGIYELGVMYAKWRGGGSQ